MKRKLLATLLSVAMATTLLAGCGSGSTEAPAAADSSSETTDTASTEAPAADGEVQEITWMFWDDLNATEDLISKGYADVIDRFNTEYAGQYHVTPITTNLEEYYPKLNALVASGDVPDVFIVSPGPNLTDYVEPGVAAPLDSYLADGWKDTFTSDAVFSQQTYDGQIYAVPLNIAAACCFYNTEMFEAAGAKVPTNWSEMLDACEKLQAAGYTPITISAGTAWCLSMVAGYLCESKGVDLAAIADGSDTWENGKLEAAATDLVELSKYFQKTAAGDTNDVATANFYNEEAAILIQGSWAIGQINGENPDFESKCGVFQFPGVERVIAKSDSLAMSSTSKCPEACVALMKMFTDDTAQKYTAEVGGKIPVTNVEYDANVAPAQLAYVMDVFSNAKGTFGFYNESMPSTEAGAHFDDDMVAVFLGDMTPAEAATDMEEFYAANCR
ncbi:ABC transporter substrate-binding protein [Lacrimispora saccharolytica]|uniref:ABC transporter substrate-binding protein n=1 Tax=Lacrimispora saccharolytica TaxID=84030 RepID=UPI00265C9B31|nr:extracellular solute-binding protein [Lacrimispora saccharolytica]MCI7557937.1 extracellular solute-binding protein [Lachnospiraceae bacterium]MCF2656525.1 extracellular solute-binding protein [Lacrimispora saccharolytica]MDD6010045.1 extracellular solute-binding protein [Lachnospiraceae bacterium]MDD7548353.1 extracellular solute-binding protein [Lachnospiraceae bacterium]MDY4126361.1 extracellular solute-binding protein [Lachnospiraceae bacterium]